MRTLHVIDSTKDKLRAVLAQIGILKTSDFPHKHSEEALDHLRDLFEDDLKTLEHVSASSDLAVSRQACADVQEHIEQYFPILGFILRSTNVRNAFEFHEPLLSLVRILLKPNFKLVLSSEWEFSLFTYLPLENLQDFVLIGLPASESSNALVLPAAGHELGHHIWNLNRLNADFLPLIQDGFKRVAAEKTDLIQSVCPSLLEEIERIDDPNVLDDLKQLAQRQCQELFCDLVGLRVFGIGFLHTIHYLLSANAAEIPHPEYPPLEQRVKVLAKAIHNYFNIDPPEGFLEDFTPIPEDSSNSEESEQSQGFVRLTLINNVTQGLFENLTDRAKTVVDATEAPVPDEVETTRIYEKFFRVLVPAIECKSLADIINAGWIARHDPELWKNVGSVKDRKLSTLNDLVLKTIEVMEFEKKTGPN